ncbi:chitobiase/beta-hexosaminidase C-terminal domain-containing protein [Metabacillus sp. 84]|uniref:chitobiase/beta-hexosaminidase C-terminal domain-containing protein n=1 Tax=Metabacillus sp. 84 TaxID=3404705 RepID=UPI003CF3E92C
MNKIILILLAVLLALTAAGISSSASKKITAPSASLKAGSDGQPQIVHLNTAARDPKIFYTLDRKDPTTHSRQIIRGIPLHQSTTIRALSSSSSRSIGQVSEFTNTVETRKSIARKFLSFTDHSIPYRLFIPDDYTPEKRYPLVLFLHGRGDRGSDNTRQLLGSDGAAVWASLDVQRKHPCFVLAPQARRSYDGGFSVTRDRHNRLNPSTAFQESKDGRAAYEIVMKTIHSYSIDRTRIYATGLSQGGFGTFTINAEHPELFAAMIPISGGGDPGTAAIIKDKPMWIFHAADDQTIPVSYSRNMVHALKKAGAHPIYTEYPPSMKIGHGAWVPAYKNHEVMEWLFQQRMRK